MKTTKRNTIAGFISCLAITASSAHAAAVISLAFNGNTVDTTSGFAINSTTDSNLNDVAWSDAVTGTSGVVDVSFSASASNTPFIVGRTASGGIGTGAGTLSGNAGTITINNIALTFVSGDSFTVDGFTSLTFAATGTGGVYTILAPAAEPNVTVGATGSYTTSGPATSVRFDANSSSTLSFTGAGIQLTGIADIPEPSTALLGGVGMLALLRRRRA